MIGSMMIGLTGYIASRFLFSDFPSLDGTQSLGDAREVSVIIPARNEALTLPLLLEDLKGQSVQPREVICVDDESEDGTAQIASSYGAHVVAVPPRPDGWFGKPWACQTGALAARGKHLLFLDADVRLAPNALASLMTAYRKGDPVISIQPFHAVPKGYEQLALLFNILQFGANGAALPKQRVVGLFGPVILMSRKIFDQIDGYTHVRSSIVEDVALGECLRKSDIGFRVYAGLKMISFRMYREGFGSLIQGWTKNFAAGAAKTPVWLFALVSLWVTGCLSAPLYLFLSIIQGDWIMAGVQAIVYALWAIELYRIANKLGSFKLLTIVAYPVSLVLFLFVFLRSATKRILKSPVLWKDRAIHQEN